MIIGAIKGNSFFLDASQTLIGALVTCVVTVFLVSIFNRSTKLERANKIIISLEKHKEEFGEYPENVNGIITEDDSRVYRYWTDSTFNEFNLSYSINGWDINQYSSVTGVWLEID